MEIIVAFLVALLIVDFWGWYDVKRKLRRIMSNVDEIKTELEAVDAVVTSVAGDVDSLIAQVIALKEQIGNGGVATQEDLDVIFNSVQNLKARLNVVDSKEPAPTE